MVGSVIVHSDKIIGEGWHHRSGEPHAEVNAIHSVKDESLLTNATIYVSLEPCSHFGKTPPCSDLIIAKGIKNVVIGMVDPFEEVAGRGIKKLMEAGHNVTIGILEEECQKLNKRFITFHTKKRPYIFLKWAQSNDGFLAPKTKDEQKPVWITNAFSKQLVHKWRSEEQAILVGTETALADNPSLTTREWNGENPVRVVLDKNLRLPQDLAIFNSEAKTIVITAEEKENSESIHFEKIDFSKPIAQQICEVLYKHNLQSLIVEGGQQTLQTFIDEDLWDEAFVFEGNVIFKNGTKAPSLKNKEITSATAIEKDQLTTYKHA